MLIPTNLLYSKSAHMHFLHLVPIDNVASPYPQATSLVKAGRLKTLSGVTLAAQPDNVSGICITGGSGAPTGGCRIVKGPVAIPVGNVSAQMCSICFAHL